MYVNSVVEFSKEDIDSPIKYYADDTLFYDIDLATYNAVNLYLRQSELSVSKSWLWYGNNSYQYHSIKDFREYSSKLKATESKIAGLYLRISDYKEVQEIKLMGVFDIVAVIGGLIVGLMNLRIVVAFFASDLSMAWMAENLYKF